MRTRVAPLAELSVEIVISRQSSITPVFGEKFDFLKNLIVKENCIVEKYFIELREVIIYMFDYLLNGNKLYEHYIKFYWKPY